MALGLAAAYFAVRERESAGGADGPSGATAETRHDAASVTEPAEDRATSLPDRSPDRAVAPDAPAESERQPTLATDEQIRTATIPLERALGGIEESELKIPVPPVAEFGDTLRQFAAETDDPSWSAATETRIFSEISQATGLAAGDIQVDCRTTLCRVLLTRPVSAPNARYRSFNELVDSFGLETAWIFAMPDENGTLVSVAYVRRGP